ncbi:WAT1-related protein At5g07050 [Cryptomeria japonica]|uniref:WAT1-related protein At5g07050 n=1 Tax=Cryptomeria japonica TaxID=3369 RepID=UPI0025AC674A|nr:WAT1-related protein At5g07050 [Cryptomeria japonica]XP_057853598.1 WAT1-related protein At5g07050 [Cryptomeria japonica]
MGMEMFHKAKPYIAMISLQFGYAVMHIITKMSLNNGMNHFVLVVYRHIVATVVLAPFAYFLERKLRPKMTFIIFCQIFALGLLGPVIDQNFYYLGLKFTSPTFGAALNNILPATTFVIAFIFRMEKIRIRQLRSQAKIVGTLVCVGGAMFMTFYKGPIVPMPWSLHAHYHYLNAVASHDNIKGCLCLVTATLSWASLFVLQASVLKKYPAQLSLVTLICLMGALQSIVITLAVERHPSAWAVGFDMNLLTAVYSGVIGTGVAYYLQGLCMKTKGPVFATAFIPLTMVFTAIMDSIILHQRIYLGSVLGGVVIVIGLYGVLWGKVKDIKLSAFTSSEMLPTCHSNTDKNLPVIMEARGEAFTDKGISNIKSHKSEEN